MLCATQDYPFDALPGRRFGGDFDREPHLRHRLPGAAPRRRRLPRARCRPSRSPSAGREAPAGARELSCRSDDDHGLRPAPRRSRRPGRRARHACRFPSIRMRPRAVRLKATFDGETDAFAARPRAPWPDRSCPVFFRLFALPPDGSDLLLYRARAGFCSRIAALVPAAATAATGGFVGNGASDLYEAGELGPTLAHGRGRHGREALPRDGAPRRAPVRATARLRGGTARAGRCSSATCRFRTSSSTSGGGSSTRPCPATIRRLAARLRPFLDEGLRRRRRLRGRAPPSRRRRTRRWPSGADHGMTACRTPRAHERRPARSGPSRPWIRRGPRRPRAHPGLLPRGAASFLLSTASTDRGASSRPTRKRPSAPKSADMLRGLRDPRDRRPLVVDGRSSARPARRAPRRRSRTSGSFPVSSPPATWSGPARRRRAPSQASTCSSPERAGDAGLVRGGRRGGGAGALLGRDPPGGRRAHPQPHCSVSSLRRSDRGRPLAGVLARKPGRGREGTRSPGSRPSRKGPRRP